ncbi:hypothetical protein EV196_10275 [Mariniflexile fucanivorans]|uniref:Lipoprotein n=1 Tax=Mariniflexile fucanivorans TaxID=264023 RepID=A0A4R1RN18_9FLAO|nr:hypothetical protein [Mariniflexile fucanivorans]TCL67519.1 hypothetical protein EV196_10275 [Mariniflexile fucanivorans]
MRNLLKITSILCTIVLLTNCAAFGTKTLYKKETNSLIKPKTLGFSQLESKPIIDKIVIGTSDIYDQIMASELNKMDIESHNIEYPNFEKWTDLEKQKISDICASNKLDGIIFTQLIFINTKYSMMLIPVGKSQDTEVEMQYFDSNGNLILHTKHNTAKGNSYLDYPDAKKNCT